MWAVAEEETVTNAETKARVASAQMEKAIPELGPVWESESHFSPPT